MSGQPATGDAPRRLTVPSVPAWICTAYWRASQPFHGRPNSPDGSDQFATEVWVQRYQVPGSLAVADLTVDHTDIRVELTAAACRQLAADLLDVAAGRNPRRRQAGK